jgi:hypothetical protein
MKIPYGMACAFEAQSKRQCQPTMFLDVQGKPLKKCSVSFYVTKRACFTTE